MRPLMVLGCTSGAGKSWLVTALCRWFARQGVDVVPFKAQNMSNNARVVDGGEIGVAQWLQARAAGVEPDVRMNPVLLKPEADTRSQVVIAGGPSPELTAMPWRDRGPALWPAMAAAFDALRAEHELVVLEGAGSPAEINLPDLVNNRMLAHADAAALLVADIDRGGAFAHLYGTWSLVPPTTRERLAGYVLNRFRGDARCCARAGAADRTDRDGLRRGRADAAPRAARRGGRHGPRRPGPGAPASRCPVPVRLQPRRAAPPRPRRPGDVRRAPGRPRRRRPRRPAGLQARGRRPRLATGPGLARRSAVRVRVLGICGGCQVLGRSIDDPAGVEGGRPGRGRARPAAVRHRARAREGHGAPRREDPRRPPRAVGRAARGDGDGLRDPRRPHAGGPVWAAGRVLATTVHGLLEDPDVVERLVGRRPRRCWRTRSTSSPTPSTPTSTPPCCGGSSSAERLQCRFSGALDAGAMRGMSSARWVGLRGRSGRAVRGCAPDSGRGPGASPRRRRRRSRPRRGPIAGRHGGDGERGRGSCQERHVLLLITEDTHWKRDVPAPAVTVNTDGTEGVVRDAEGPVEGGTWAPWCTRRPVAPKGGLIFEHPPPAAATLPVASGSGADDGRGRDRGDDHRDGARG